MTLLTLVAALLALLWGLILALLLQCTRKGRFIAKRRTWIAVAAGVGIDILILALVLPLPAWLNVVIVIVASAVPIIIRSLINEYNETEDELESAGRRSN